MMNRLLITSFALVSMFCASLSCQAQATVPPLPSRVQDVVKLTKAGLSEDVILSQVKNAGVTYNLTADQLIYLSGQGVSQNVIKALIQGDGSQAPAPPAPVSPNTLPPPPIITPTTPAPPVTAPGLTAATPPVSYDYFHDQLAGSGTWMNDPGLGWCWRPSIALADPYWRPYFDAGHWVYTDSGWFWQSDYPWGEIAFHYGRWQRDSVSWFWVPGYDWAPAWVSWRQSEGYCGWAPLPPTAVFRAGVGLTFGGRVALDLDFGLAPDAFTFVAFDHFWDRNLHPFLLPRERIDFVFRRSFVANGYRFDHGRFFVEGLGRDHIAAYTHHEIRIESPIFHDSRIGGHVEMERRGFRDDRRDQRDRRDRY
ncbi:MAG: hypothetical protein JWQ04_56 [Pedosphaera sp.]|nr:hypothetical protein [Pedosphaera sp.]